MINSIKSIIVLFIIFAVLALGEISYRNIVLIFLTILALGVCYLLGNYWLLKLFLIVDYCLYFLDTSYYITEKDEVIVDKRKYLRFNNKKKEKGSSNTITIYITVHLVLLFLAIMVG